jgi:hypothetical protein
MKDVLDKGKEYHFTIKMLRRALKSLGGVSHKASFSGPWLWALRLEDAQRWREGAEDSHSAGAGPSGEDGHLGVALDENRLPRT